MLVQKCVAMQLRTCATQHGYASEHVQKQYNLVI